MKFLSYDALPARIVRWIWNLFLLNLCMLVCCLPVITVGVTLSAAFSAFYRAEDETRLVGTFFRAWRENWKQATVIWLIFLGVFLFLGADMYFLLNYSFRGDGFLKAVWWIVFVLTMSVFCFAFPMQARYENRTGMILRNSLLLGTTRLFTGLTMVVLTLLPLIAFWVSMALFVVVLAVWIPFGFSVTAMVNSWLAKRVFLKVQPDPVPGEGGPDDDEGGQA